MAAPVYVGLLHYPIYNRRGEVITTAITNFDIHDIARTCRTYGVSRYFIVHPLESQAALAKEIISYWMNGYGGQYNPDRKEAFGVIEVVADVHQAVNYIIEREGVRPRIVTTDARKYDRTTGYREMRRMISEEPQPLLILFGTGWGIERAALESFDFVLDPIPGRTGYNHLSVRGAAAIILDRLLGENWWDG